MSRTFIPIKCYFNYGRNW